MALSALVLLQLYHWYGPSHISSNIISSHDRNGEDGLHYIETYEWAECLEGNSCHETRPVPFNSSVCTSFQS